LLRNEEGIEAIKNGDVEKLKVYLPEMESSINVDNKDMTPLGYAIKCLLSHNLENIHEANENNYLECVKIISGACQENKDQQALDEALILACNNNIVDVMEILLDAGANPNYKKKYQDVYRVSITPLFAVIKSIAKDIKPSTIFLLLQYGADKNVETRMLTHDILIGYCTDVLTVASYDAMVNKQNIFKDGYQQFSKNLKECAMKFVYMMYFFQNNAFNEDVSNIIFNKMIAVYFPARTCQRILENNKMQMIQNNLQTFFHDNYIKKIKKFIAKYKLSLHSKSNASKNLEAALRTLMSESRVNESQIQEKINDYLKIFVNRIKVDEQAISITCALLKECGLISDQALNSYCLKPVNQSNQQESCRIS